MSPSPPTHPAALPIETLLKSCDTLRLRRGGPGGQHRNKVETAVVLTHRTSGVSAEANEKRSQAQNLEQALFRLRTRLALAVRTEPEDALVNSPSRVWRSRAARGKLAVNPAHADFPSLLAEAIDVLAACGWSDRDAADHLQVSRTQLVRFLGQEPAALELLNQQRKKLGLTPLR